MADHQDTSIFKATEFEVRFVSSEPTRQRSAALMGTIFGMPILMLGIVLLVGALTGLMTEGDEIGPRMLIALLSLPFVLFGGWIVLVGLRSYLTTPVASRRPTGKTHTETVYTDSFYFPRGRRIFGARRGFIALQSDLETHNAAPMQAVGALLWSLVGTLLLWLVLRGEPGVARYMAAVMAGTFAILGVMLLGVSVWRLLRRKMARTAIVEAKKEVLAPGESTIAAVTLRKPIPCDGVRLSLQCKESVQVGTGEALQTFEEIVQYESLHEAAGVAVLPGKPLFEGEVAIPEDAMHSFVSPQASIKWGISLELYRGSELVLQRFYLLRVGPG